MTKPSEVFSAAMKAAVATTQSLASLQEPLLRSARLIEECLGSGHKLLVCGNGGSAADAADFATEFACRFMHDRPPYPAMNLAQGGSLTTAIGNDYGFEEIFARQVTAFGERGDVLIAITTSGNSRNVVRAIEEARIVGLTSVAFLGRDGGSARNMADIELLVPSDSTARIQEAHKFLLHVLCEIVEASLHH
jgi:D-sedoheptulose 7-phosphate isomerase